MIHLLEHLVLLPIIDGDRNNAGDGNDVCSDDDCKDGMVTGLW